VAQVQHLGPEHVADAGHDLLVQQQLADCTATGTEPLDHRPRVVGSERVGSEPIEQAGAALVGEQLAAGRRDEVPCHGRPIGTQPQAHARTGRPVGIAPEHRAAHPEVDVQVGAADVAQEVLAEGVHLLDPATVDGGCPVGEAALRRGGPHLPTDELLQLPSQAVERVALRHDGAGPTSGAGPPRRRPVVAASSAWPWRQARTRPSCRRNAPAGRW
jgi:hypothetical protein